MTQAVGRRGSFLTTRWSLIFAAQRQEPASGVLNTLCEIYWYPVYAFIRRQGFNAADAEDLTQSFFSRLLEQETIRSADRERGRFRSFLLASVKHFLSHERERAQAQKRGGNVQHVSFDADSSEDVFQQERPAPDATPEELFERRSALAMLNAALEQLHAQYEQSGKRNLFEVLAPFLEGPPENGYEVPAAQLGFTVGNTRVAMCRLRKEFHTTLRRLIAATVPSDRVDDEILYLKKTLSC